MSETKWMPEGRTEVKMQEDLRYFGVRTRKAKAYDTREQQVVKQAKALYNSSTR